MIPMNKKTKWGFYNIVGYFMLWILLLCTVIEPCKMIWANNKIRLVLGSSHRLLPFLFCPYNNMLQVCYIGRLVLLLGRVVIMTTLKWLHRKIGKWSRLCHQKYNANTLLTLFHSQPWEWHWAGVQQLFGWYIIISVEFSFLFCIGRGIELQVWLL